MQRLYLLPLVLIAPLAMISCSRSSPDIRVPDKAGIPPYPAELERCEARAQAKLEQCAGEADTAGEVAQCQTKHGRKGFSCLDASEQVYKRVRETQG